MKKTVIPEKISNTLIEKMFFICAEEHEIEKFIELLQIPKRGHGLATAYASKKVTNVFVSLMHEQTGLDYSICG